jgi:hypothetical protein
MIWLTTNVESGARAVKERFATKSDFFRETASSDVQNVDFVDDAPSTLRTESGGTQTATAYGGLTGRTNGDRVQHRDYWYLAGILAQIGIQRFLRMMARSLSSLAAISRSTP